MALCILAIVLLSVYRLHSQTISMSIESRFYTQAPLLARGALARWEEARKPEMMSDQGDFGKEFPGYQWKIASKTRRPRPWAYSSPGTCAASTSG